MPPRRLPRRGFTLLEVLLATAITAVLCGSMAAILMVGVNALDGGATARQDALAAAAAAELLTADLREATLFTAVSDNSIAFTVPDRNRDNAEESIEYLWSKDAGAPLLRSTNGGGDVQAVANVQQFDLALTLRPPPTTLESAEGVIWRYPGSADGASPSFAINANKQLAQYLRPLFNGSVVSWSITRIRLPINRSGASDCTLRVIIARATSDRLPGGPTLASVTVSESALNAQDVLTLGLGPVNVGVSGDSLLAVSTVPVGWSEIDIDVTDLAPGDGLVILLSRASGSGSAAKASTSANGTNMPFNTHMLTSNDNGLSWTAPSDAIDMPFEIIGTVTTRSE